jgi:hypothetical protein
MDILGLGSLGETFIASLEIPAVNAVREQVLTAFTPRRPLPWSLI